MAAADRHTRTSVIEALLDDPHGWEFFQIVRLLELAHPDRIGVGLGPDPARETLRFRADPRLSFPPSEVTEVVAGEDEGRAPFELTVSFLGLIGSQGPLPRVDSERVLRRLQRKDRALADFLDIFHHRLVALLYRARQKHRPAMRIQPPESSPMATALFSSMGLGSAELRRLAALPERALLGFAPLLALGQRSAVGLERLLSSFFNLSVRVEQFVGVWREVEPQDRTAIGRPGLNRTLGQGAMLGRRAWQQDGTVEIQVGPMPLERYRGLLPTRSTLDALFDVCTLYLREADDVRVRLLLAHEQVPDLQDGGPGPEGRTPDSDGRHGWVAPTRPTPAVRIRVR